MDAYLKVLHELLTRIKSEEKNPYIILGGDLNNFDLADSLNDFLDVEVIASPPTRGDHRLDLIYSNMTSLVTDCVSGPPLENEAGVQSDHLKLLAQMEIPQRHDFSWNIYHARENKKKSLKKFLEEYTTIDWEEEMRDCPDPSSMTDRLHSITNKLNDTHFHIKEKRSRSTDDPWISDEIKQAIRRRKRLFNNHRRNAVWTAAKKVTNYLIKEAKEKF